MFAGQRRARCRWRNTAQDPFGNALFCFIGKGRDKLKILYCNRNGFVVWYKVIEGKEKFHWPRRSEEAVVQPRSLNSSPCCPGTSRRC
jgi:hypothetical protein